MTGRFDNALWLAGRQIRDNWTSYLFSAIYFGFMGLVLASDENIGVEIALPVLMFIVIQPSLSPRYMTWKQDNDVSRHQVFLHSLPLGFDVIISARVIAMLLAGVINVPLLFLPFWYLGPEWSSFGSFLGWSTFWIGLGLAGAGLALVQEFWLPMREWVKANFVLVLIVVGVLIVMQVFSGIRPYRQTVDLANDSPWIMALIGIVLGSLGLWQGAVLAVRGFRKREFAT